MQVCFHFSRGEGRGETHVQVWFQARAWVRTEGVVVWARSTVHHV